jgi:hypothetical protein
VSTTTRTFGTVIKAARLRFHWSEKLGCYVRLGGDRAPFICDLAPADKLPDGKDREQKQEWRVWWETPADVAVVESCPGLQGLEVTRPMRVWLGEHGERVR